MAENPELQKATIPEQPASASPINKKQPLLILLVVVLIVLVISSVIRAVKKAAPMKSQLTAKPATADPQQVKSFQAQQQQAAKKDQEEQQQRAATAALLMAIQDADAPGPESKAALPMTSAQRAAIYGADAPSGSAPTSQLSERQAEATQAALAKEKQHQDALSSDTMIVDFAHPATDGTATSDHAAALSGKQSDEHSASDFESSSDKVAGENSKDTAIAKYDFDDYDGKLYRVFEGSVFEGVVTNHIDGGLSGPILIMLTTDYYSHDHQQLLLPQGTRLIGQVQAVNSSQARKMVVAFDRAICPDGFSVDLDRFAGLDPLGTTGLATKVNNRYFETFAVAAAIGGLGGLAQIGNNNILDPSAEVRSGITSQSSQEAEQILNHFLNRLPIITLKEGSRARVYISRDILIPSYAEHRVDPNL